ncbi:MAG: hypothetical protein A2176_14000 [Spirochaetes bacterium RBG_13_51_14]|nr:MAG: hypothetical protein A2176_14000 [Spirochaetes bacterium RBG_13_51_14]
MSANDIITGIIEFILHRATKYELELVGEAIRKRMERESSLGLGQVDVQDAARSMAEGIEKQMGLGGEAVHQMSRRLVADMIRKEQPDISEGDLNKLLDQWVPGRGAKKPGGIPTDMLLAMITQFAAYSRGEMSEDEKRQFPAGWQEKYWNAFPSDIQKLLKDYIHGRIGKNEFWRGVRDHLAISK